MKYSKNIKEKLSKNKYIAKVTDSQVVYTNEFKIILWNSFKEGINPKEVFTNNNLDLDIIGKENPRWLLHRIRQEMKKEENKDKSIEEVFSDNRKETRGRKKKILPKNWKEELENLSIEEQNTYLKHKIALMEKESILFPNLREEIKLKNGNKVTGIKTKQFKVIKYLLEEDKKFEYELKIFLNIYNLSKSGYYRFLKQNPLREEMDLNNFKEIKAIYDENKGKYGYRQITMELNSRGLKWSKNKVQRLMQLNDLKAIIRKKRKTKPYDGIKEKSEEEKKNTFPNILKQDFEYLTPYQFFTTDITYFFYLNNQGKEVNIYLSVIKDLATKKVVAWNLSERIDMSLVTETIDKFKKYFKLNNLDISKALIHSDQGVHYTSKIYSNLLKNLGVTQSMSRKGNSYDNAPIESFFGHMKDFVDERGLDKASLIKEIYHYMDNYNDKKQWNLSKLSPNEYEKVLLDNIKGV